MMRNFSNHDIKRRWLTIGDVVHALHEIDEPWRRTLCGHLTKDGTITHSRFSAVKERCCPGCVKVLAKLFTKGDKDRDAWGVEKKAVKSSRRKGAK